MKITSAPIDSIKPYARNARHIPPSAVEKVAASIAEFGWKQPIVIDGKGEIIIGHVRHAAAKSLGYTEVPVLVASDLSPAKVKALRIADNRLHQETGWVMDTLKLELDELRIEGFNVALTGFPDNFDIGLNDRTREWIEAAAPAFDLKAGRQIVVRFDDDAAIEKFGRLLGVTITDKTKSILYRA
jgi:hypothetical protein